MFPGKYNKPKEINRTRVELSQIYCQSFLTGKLIINVVPVGPFWGSAFDFTFICPLWIFIIPYTSDNPRPVPRPIFFVVLQNGIPQRSGNKKTTHIKRHDQNDYQIPYTFHMKPKASHSRP